MCELSEINASCFMRYEIRDFSSEESAGTLTLVIAGKRTQVQPWIMLFDNFVICWRADRREQSARDDSMPFRGKALCKRPSATSFRAGGSALMMASLVFGCAGRKPVLEKTRKPSDANLDREELRSAPDDAVYRALSKQQIRIESDNADVALGLAGVLYWPAFMFIDTGNAEETEATSLVRREGALRELEISTDCDISAWKAVPGSVTAKLPLVGDGHAE